MYNPIRICKAKRKITLNWCKTYIVFGWDENREDGKQREENTVENSVFHEGKWGGGKTREKVFSSRPTIFILLNREEKAGEKSALTTLLHKCPLSLSYHNYKHNNLSLKQL